jgi:hypothetical protein
MRNLLVKSPPNPWEGGGTGALLDVEGHSAGFDRPRDANPDHGMPPG